MKAGFLRSMIAGIVTLCVVLSSAAQDSDPTAIVERLHAALLDIMQNAQSLGYEGRRDRIAPTIHESFDLPFLSRFVLGRHWSHLSPKQHVTMVETFTRLSIAQYASRFDGYSSESFKIVSTGPARSQRVLVRSVLEVSNDSSENVRLDYLLHKTDGTWRIISVIANGISDLALKRADYGVVIKSKGFDELIERINQQISDLESGD